ncbi:MAG: GatB/YqeY domain-containing protein [Gammaproteobacteria bacterium]|nr:GatB/YqeY domain-containing protein [Gammaproteobacteria bacterium]
MSLQEQIQTDMKAAMKAKESLKLGVIRMLRAAVRDREIDSQKTLDDAAVLEVINKMVKQRRDSVTQFQAAKRDELAAKEQQEIEILTAYLPAQMNETEIDAAIAKAISDTGAASMRDMGKVMGILKPALTGRADMSLISQKVKASLSEQSNA